MTFRVIRVEEQKLENGHVVTLATLNVGYEELVALDGSLPGPRPVPDNKKLCSLFVRATRPDGSTEELVASVPTFDRTVQDGVLGFYRRRYAAEVPVGTEIELLGYENSPI
jgi:hypothetical protein